MGKYISAKEYAEKHNKNYRYVRMLASTGKIEGARKRKIGGNWEIPEDSPYPGKSCANSARKE